MLGYLLPSRHSRTNTSRISRDRDIRQSLPPSRLHIIHRRRPRRPRRHHTRITPRQINSALRHASIPVDFLRQMSIRGCIVRHRADERIAPTVQGVDHVEELDLRARVRFARRHGSGGGKVLPEGEGVSSDCDFARGGEGGRGAVEELGDGGGAEVPGVAEGGAGAVVDVLGIC